MTHDQLIVAAWTAYLRGESFVLAFRRIRDAARGGYRP